MNILLISGSPRGENGNTIRLSNAFCEGITEKTNANIESINLNKLDIKDCKGCFVCWKDTPGVCCIKDDMQEMLEKIKSADIIIWSFPLYYFSLPSRIKAFMDRQLPLMLPFMDKNTLGGAHPKRYDSSQQKNVIISSCGFYTTENNYLAVNAQFDRIFGKDNYTSIFCAQGEILRTKEMSNFTSSYFQSVRNAGAELVEFGQISENTKKSLNKNFLPREIYERMADASWGIKIPKKDDNKNEQKDKAKKDEPSLIFTRQMSYLYNPKSWDGNEKVLEFYYTDIDRRYQIVMGKEVSYVIDNNFKDYTTKIETPFSVWEKISKGELSGEQALMERMYSVKGDFSLMMNWDDYFGIGSNNDVSSVKTTENNTKKTNMNLLLTPWIIVWVALSINPLVGGILGVLVCSILPFLYLRYKAVIFEYISIVMINIFCILSLLNFDIKILVSLSYLAFGLIWFATLFLKVPLTAYYSLNEFKGKNPLENRLFLRTNRIITGYFAILYILTPIWTYAMLNSPLGVFTGAVNSILPAILVAFTDKFKDFYPKYYLAKEVK